MNDPLAIFSASIFMKKLELNITPKLAKIGKKEEIKRKDRYNGHKTTISEKLELLTLIITNTWNPKDS